MVSNRYTTDDITAIIGISGQLQGNVLYGFSEQTANSIITVMLGEDSGQISNEIGLSALGEIVNVITGNAAAQLAGLGYHCDISPPVIIEPVGSKFTTVGSSQMLVSFGSSLGGLTVRISLYENRD